MENMSQAVKGPTLAASYEGKRFIISCGGFWGTHTIHKVDDAIRELEAHEGKLVILDATEISGFDTAGAFVFMRLFFALKQRGVEVELRGIKDGWRPLLNVVGQASFALHKQDDPYHETKFILFFREIGSFVTQVVYDVILGLHIVGAMLCGNHAVRRKHPATRLSAIVSQIEYIGVGALPIVVLMSFIVGAIVAQQGAFQLRSFGAEIFVVDLVSILVFRELGVLLTAIMIAGRSGSAITAEIGSMKMQQETDALQVMGLNPVRVLVFPRLVALVIVLPLLTAISNIAALVGAGLITYFYSGISYDAFIARLHESVMPASYFAGLIKAPFMALAIGIIASVEGMKVCGSAQSLGRKVTASVVKSIFMVIIMDGLFAIFYAAVNF